MEAKYPIDKTFFTAKPRPTDSWAWKCIMRNRHQFRKELQCVVGDGTNIHFWLDSWCDNCYLIDLMGFSDTTAIDTSLKVSHFILPNKTWDLAKL